MKTIPTFKKSKIIKQFFEGYTYDEIAANLDVAKGSVVNTIEAFKEGLVPAPASAYMDALRKVAVDMRKQHVNVKQLTGFAKIEKALTEMGVDTEQIENWLPIVKDLATEAPGSKEFVVAALDLAHLEAETGKDPQSLVETLHATTDELNQTKAELDEVIKQKQAIEAELAAVTAARDEAKAEYENKKEEMEAGLESYVNDLDLTMEKVDTIAAILKDESKEAELDDGQVEALAKKIREAGTLAGTVDQLTVERDGIEEDIDELNEVQTVHEEAVTLSKKVFNDFLPQVKTKMDEKQVLDGQVMQLAQDCKALVSIKNAHAYDLNVAWYMIAFMMSEGNVSEYAFQKVLEVMAGIGLARLGKSSSPLYDRDGTLICQGTVPEAHFSGASPVVPIDKVREGIAKLIFPLVDDKFVSREQWQVEQINKEFINFLKEMHEYQKELKETPTLEQLLQKAFQTNINDDASSDEATNVGQAKPKQKLNLKTTLKPPAPNPFDEAFLANLPSRTKTGSNLSFPG